MVGQKRSLSERLKDDVEARPHTSEKETSEKIVDLSDEDEPGNAEVVPDVDKGNEGEEERQIIKDKGKSAIRKTNSVFCILTGGTIEK